MQRFCYCHRGEKTKEATKCSDFVTVVMVKRQKKQQMRRFSYCRCGEKIKEATTEMTKEEKPKIAKLEVHVYGVDKVGGRANWYQVMKAIADYMGRVYGQEKKSLAKRLAAMKERTVSCNRKEFASHTPYPGWVVRVHLDAM